MKPLRLGVYGLLAATTFVTFAVYAQQNTPGIPGLPAMPDKATIDKPIKDFKLKDVMHDSKKKESEDAANIALSQFKGKKNVVLFFMSERCGTTWKYEKRVGDMLKKYAKKDVEIMGVRCSANDTSESIRKFAESKNFIMPVLNDEKGKLSSFFKITNTPTFAVIDKKGVLRYRGSFDDAPEESDVKKHYLSDAVVAVLDSKSVPVANTRPFG